MRRFALLLIATLAILMLLVGMLAAQQNGGPPPVGQAGPPEGGEAGPPAPDGGFSWRSMDRAAREEERIDTLLTEATLIGDERRAAEAALKAKMEARQELTGALEELRTAAESMRTIEPKLKEAMETYRKAMAKYRGIVDEQDKALIEKLSTRSQARCLALGILDNAVGSRGAFGRRRGGDGERGGRFQGGPDNN